MKTMQHLRGVSPVNVPIDAFELQTLAEQNPGKRYKFVTGSKPNRQQRRAAGNKVVKAAKKHTAPKTCILAQGAKHLE